MDNLKKCSRCKEVKDVNKFFYRKTRKDYTSYCKSCSSETQKLRAQERKFKAIQISGGACSNCGYNRNMSALAFHHIDPKEKNPNWNQLKNWDSILEELKKCILLCHNCHSELHHPNLFLNNYQPTNLINKILNESLDDTKKSLTDRLHSTGECPHCYKKVFNTIYCSINCVKCHKRKCIRPSKEELKDLINTTSFLAIGRKFGVSDNSVRKWAKIYGIL